MPKFAKQLPDHLDKFKAEVVISMADSATFLQEVRRIGDRYLAETYLGLPAIHRASVYGDFLEREMVDRFCEHYAMIPDLVLLDD